MKAADEADEERGTGEVAAVEEVEEPSSGIELTLGDDHGARGNGQGPSASDPVGGHRSIFGRFHRGHAHRSTPDGRSSERSTATGGGRWRSLAGSRMIKLATQQSDVGGDDVRGIVATPMDSAQGRAMAPGARFRANLQAEVEVAPPQFLRMKSNVDEEGGDAEQGGVLESEERNQMYRLQATRGSMDVGCCRRTIRFLLACINCGALTESATEQNLYLGFGDPNRWLMFFFFWLFRKGWATVIVLSVVWYYVLVLLFAFIIVGASDLDNDCVKVGGSNIGDLETRSKFMDAFSLSWNTFSTVGYGSTYPALSTEGDTGGSDSRCAFINFVTSLEAFVGVIFAGFIGAIFFAKVARITQRADVRFSDPLTVRFGSGVDPKAADDENTEMAQSEKRKAKEEEEAVSPLQKFRALAKKVGKPSPFPVITFRIANKMHNTLGGEIISANVKAVVLIESTRYDDQVSEDLAKQIHLDRVRRASKDTPKMRKKSVSVRSSKDSNGIGVTERTIDSTVTDESSAHSDRSKKLQGTESAMTYLQTLNALAYKSRFGGAKKMKIDDEEGGSSSKIVPRMVFTNLKLETSEHPLFKRIWRFKHVIDQDSPLLTAEAQKAIIENGGKWPWQWNNHEAVRNAIRFNQMVVSFTGISNISGASVYKQKVYDYVDTVVGYQFVNALYRGRFGNLKVDLRLINDVVEQNGGGGEPLSITIETPS